MLKYHFKTYILRHLLKPTFAMLLPKIGCCCETAYLPMQPSWAPGGHNLRLLGQFLQFMGLVCVQLHLLGLRFQGLIISDWVRVMVKLGFVLRFTFQEPHSRGLGFRILVMVSIRGLQFVLCFRVNLLYLLNLGFQVLIIWGCVRVMIGVKVSFSSLWGQCMCTHIYWDQGFRV